MSFYHIQRNSLIGSGEAKTQNSRSQTSKSRPGSRFRGLLRPAAGLFALSLCTFLAGNRESGFVSAGGETIATISADRGAFQRADIIDDIVEIIEKIVNPDPPEDEEPNP